MPVCSAAYTRFKAFLDTEILITRYATKLATHRIGFFTAFPLK